MSMAEYLQQSRFGLLYVRLATGLLLSLMAVLAENESTSRQTGDFPGTDLFANDSVLRIQVEIGPQELQSLRKESRRYVRSTIFAGGRVYHDVGLHLKGSTGSFRGVDDKPGLTLDFSRFDSDQKFHGLRKIHLNNSVEDPSYVNEQIGSELFRAAGLPAPRVSHALVELNGRQPGLYVLKDGFTEDFLGIYFRRVDGNLYDTDSGHDVDEHMKQLLGRDRKNEQKDLRSLAAAAREPDLSQRWPRLESRLEVDRFITFMALEIMICHRDGYCLARNNFRIYDNPETRRMVFFPHGMDQLFGKADLPWKPHLAGMVAQSLLETTEGRRRYETRFNKLFTDLFVVDRLTNRVNQIVGSLRPYLEKEKFRSLEQEAAVVRDRIVRREVELRKQLSRQDPTLLDFAGGVARLTGWMKTDELDGCILEEAGTIDGVATLHIVAGPKTAASWKTTVLLRRGRYRFEGQAMISAVTPLPFGKNQGAGLHVTSKNQEPLSFTGSSSWKNLEVEFQVDSDEEGVELLCQLRATSGEAWFDKNSLHLVQIQHGPFTSPGTTLDQ
jgi:hypothetical protein